MGHRHQKPGPTGGTQELGTQPQGALMQPSLEHLVENALSHRHLYKLLPNSSFSIFAYPQYVPFESEPCPLRLRLIRMSMHFILGH